LDTVDGVGSPAMARLDQDPIALPRDARDEGIGREEDQSLKPASAEPEIGLRTLASLIHDFVETELDTSLEVRDDLNAFGEGADQLGWRGVGGPARGLSHARARQQRQHREDRARPTHHPSASSCARNARTCALHVASFSRSFSITAAGARATKLSL